MQKAKFSILQGSFSLLCVLFCWGEFFGFSVGFVCSCWVFLWVFCGCVLFVDFWRVLVGWLIFVVLFCFFDEGYKTGCHHDHVCVPSEKARFFFFLIKKIKGNLGQWSIFKYCFCINSNTIDIKEECMYQGKRRETMFLSIRKGGKKKEYN